MDNNGSGSGGVYAAEKIVNKRVKKVRESSQSPSENMWFCFLVATGSARVDVCVCNLCTQ